MAFWLVMDQDNPLPGAHGQLPCGCKASFLQDLPEQSIEFLRVVRDKEESPLEVMRVHLEEFDEFVKLDQFIRHIEKKKTKSNWILSVGLGGCWINCSGAS